MFDRLFPYVTKLVRFHKLKQVFTVIKKKKVGFVIKRFVIVQNSSVTGLLKPTKHDIGSLTGFIKGQR